MKIGERRGVNLPNGSKLCASYIKKFWPLCCLLWVSTVENCPVPSYCECLVKLPFIWFVRLTFCFPSVLWFWSWILLVTHVSLNQVCLIRKKITSAKSRTVFYILSQMMSFWYSSVISIGKHLLGSDGIHGGNGYNGIKKGDGIRF